MAQIAKYWTRVEKTMEAADSYPKEHYEADHVSGPHTVAWE